MGNKKLDKAKEWVEMLNVALKCIFLAKKITFDRLFFFEFMTIIQVFLRGLGKIHSWTKYIEKMAKILVEPTNPQPQLSEGVI